MARRKRKGGKSKSIPMAIVVPIAYVGLDAYRSYGLSTQMLAKIMKSTTGYDPAGKKFDAAAATPFWMGSLAGIVVHKVANKTGINKHVRKLTMGYLSI